MDADEILMERAADVAFDRLKEAGGDPRELPHHLRVVAVIYSAQGVLDNGGLAYFLAADFPGNPPYSIFVEAYKEIGALDAAVALEGAVALFPFKDPHLHAEKRTAFLQSFENAELGEVPSPFAALTRELCGNEGVWRCLASFVVEHRAAIGLA